MPDTQLRRKILTTPILNSNVEKELTEADKGDDLTETYKREYAVYAAEQSLLNHDQYALTKDYSTLPAFTNQDGTTVPIAEVDSNQPSSLQETDAKTRSLFSSISTSGQLTGDGEDSFQIRKGKENVSGPTPQFLIDDAQKNKQQSEVAKRVRKLLISNNGLDDYGVAAVSEGTGLPGTTVVGTTPARKDEQRVVGVTTPQNLPLGTSPGRKFPDATPALLEENLIKIKDLKKLGLAVMLGASGEIAEPNYRDDSFDTTGLTKFELLSTPPSLARLGQKVPVSRFSAAKVFEKIKPGAGLGDNKVSPLLELADEGMSYGSPYSPAVPASGITSIPQIVSATALVLAFGTLLKTTAAVMSATSKARGSTVQPDFSRETRRRSLGKAYGTADNSTDDQFINTGYGFDITTTRFDYDQALNKGVEVFFAGTIDSTSAVALGVAGNVMKTPGFYSGVLMEILRDLDTIGLGSGLAGALGNSSTANVADTVRELGDPQNILANIKESKLFRFVNILAALGDIALTANMLANGETISGVTDVYTEDEFYRELIEVDIPGTNVNTSSEKLLDPTVHQIKYRLSDGKSSWANNSLRSLLLHPTAIGDGKRLLGIPDNGGDVLRSHAVVPNEDGINPVSGRIKQATLDAMERYLEKDYIPFYFHDVRTNEVVTTPAFLESIDESFTVEYAETEGYGRIGSVPVYKNTKRTISLSFKMIALNDDDHNMMWYKINRLGMMLMPQWTKGRQIQFGNNKIIQPFSQQIAASPLIRLRLGDLYKTNYSQYGLARLFGIASGGGASNSNSFNLESFQQNTTAVTNAREEQQRRRAAVETILTRQRNVGLSLRQRFQIGDHIRVSAGNYAYRDVPPPGSIASTPTSGPNVRNRVRGGRARASDGREPVSNNAEVRVVGYFGGTEERPDCLLVELVRTGGAATTSGASPSRQYMIELGPRIIPDITLITPPATAQPNEPQNQATTSTLLSTQEFMSDKNPVFKAYKSTRGKGIPGFITSFGLGIDTNHLWLIEKFNARAPQIVTINIQFNPLYDLQPGLDHNGFMTAPLWNVGDVMKANFNDTTSDNEVKSDNAREDEYNRILNTRGTPRRII